MRQYKQVFLVRQDLKLSKGKMAAQVAHACLDAVEKSQKETVRVWKMQGGKKSVLKVKDLQELKKYVSEAENAGLKISVITDAGHTHLEPGTTTVAAIGPDEEDKIDAVTGELKLVS